MGRIDHAVQRVEHRARFAGDHPHRLHVTGMYGHTGSAMPTPGDVAGEAGTMLDTLYSVIDAPHEAL